MNDFLCANILEDQAQRHDKTKGLRNLVIVQQSANRMDEGARKLRRIGNNLHYRKSLVTLDAA